MDVSEPRPRHRGYFLTVGEPIEVERGEDEAAEGLRIRVRIVRRHVKRRAVAALHPAVRPSGPADARLLAHRVSPAGLHPHGRRP